MFKRIMVTGGSATAGGGLQDAVSRGEYSDRDFFFPRSRECNLLDARDVQRYLESIKPDAIIHFAAVSGGIQLTLNYPASVMRDNVLMNFNLVEAARLLNIPKIVLTLSGGMYPKDIESPIKEESIHAGPPFEASYSYAFAKRLLEPMIRAYRQEYAMDVIGIVPDGILGPGANFNPKLSTAIPALVRRFYEGREGGEPLVVWGDGSPRRQLTFGEDVGRAAMWCLDNYSDAQILNVGTMEEISIKEAAFMVAEDLGIDRSRITFDTTKPAGLLRRATDNSKFVSLSHFQYTPVRHAIKKTVEFFAANYPDPAKLRL